MTNSNSRRRFLRETSIATVGTALMSQSAEAKPPKSIQYKGEGENLVHALTKAVKAAQNDIRVPDGRVDWRLVEIHGAIGGLVSNPIYKVTIEKVR